MEEARAAGSAFPAVAEEGDAAAAWAEAAIQVEAAVIPVADTREAEAATLGAAAVTQVVAVVTQVVAVDIPAAEAGAAAVAISPPAAANPHLPKPRLP
ncbi:MAG: hypothetical protein WDN31_04915 [Hyphomicrobium sp.]